MKRWRERKRDDLLRRGPRLARRPSRALVSPQPPSAFPRPTLDAYTVAPYLPASAGRPPPTLSPAVPLCHPPLHDPPGCDYLLPLFPIRPFPHPSYPTLRCLRRHPTTDPNPWRPFALSRGCESRAAVYSGGMRRRLYRTKQASLQRATGKLP